LEQAEPSDLVDREYHWIGTQTALILSYMGIFIATEAAFLVMALKEYLHDVLGISEDELYNS
jgi:hypothetical protein